MKRTLTRTAGLAAALLSIAGLSLPAASAATVRPAVDGPITTCSIQTSNGHYLTAVGGGGRTTDVIHTNATIVQAWEKFTIVAKGDARGLRTSGGFYLTAVDSGGRTTDVIHSNATVLSDWENFALDPLGNDLYAIEAIDGHLLTAVGGGGRTTDTIHSNAVTIGPFETFRLNCGL
jgi:hypothetical protein